jgi:2-polyprenyl-6-methoxyphenol hydroxylase-like FAD-dependent oxidoreductase
VGRRDPLDNAEPQQGKLAVGCGGIHSALRQLVANEGPPKYSGVNMWRGAVASRPISAATMV